MPHPERLPQGAALPMKNCREVRLASRHKLDRSSGSVSGPWRRRARARLKPSRVTSARCPRLRVPTILRHHVAKVARVERSPWLLAIGVLIFGECSLLSRSLLPESCAGDHVARCFKNNTGSAAEAMAYLRRPEVAGTRLRGTRLSGAARVARTQDHETGAGVLGTVLQKHLAQLKSVPIESLVAARPGRNSAKIAQFYSEG